MKNFALIILLALGTLLQAENYDTFIGIEAGSTKVRLDQSDSERGGEYGLRIGFIRDTGRAYISGSMADLDHAKLYNIALNFDAITPRAYHFNDSFALRGFLGVHGGYTQIDPDNFSKDESGMGGGKAGVFLDLPANISIEIGYKVTWTSVKIGNESVQNYQKIYAAYNYTF